jgi:SAM-dependent methyltransferase
MASKESIKSFWNGAAKDNPYYYVSSYGSYGADRNLNEFWASGRTIWSDLKRLTGYVPKPNDVVVEIGCGVGRLTRAIAPEVQKVIALDISGSMLAVAREANLPNVDFREVEGFALPSIADRSVDLVLAYCVFQHLPSNAAMKSYLDEMLRVAKRPGMIAFTLVPRDRTTWLLPAFRLRAYFRERFSRSGPKGIYRKEWVGIRPGKAAVCRMASISLEQRALDADRVLYFGIV